VKDDPVRKDTRNGVVAEWAIAIDGKHREWIGIEVWGHLAGTCAQHLRAGRRIAVTGSLRTKQWNDRDGNRQRIWFCKANDVTFLDPPPSAGTGQPNQSKVAT